MHASIIQSKDSQKSQRNEIWNGSELNKRRRRGGKVEEGGGRNGGGRGGGEKGREDDEEREWEDGMEVGMLVTKTQNTTRRWKNHRSKWD